jgi:thiol-disulfide isomerase/thioredoxin
VIAQELPPDAPAPPVAPAADPFAVPKGTAEELLKYVDELRRAQPTSESREVVMEFLHKRAVALLKAAESILAAGPNAEQLKAAVQYKIAALAMLDRLGEPGMGRRLEALPAALERAGLKELALAARCAALQSRLRSVETMSPKDLGQLFDEVARCLKQSGSDPNVIQLAVSAAMSAESSNRPEMAIRAYTQFGTILAGGSDEKTAGLGAAMQGAVRRLGLLGKTMPLEAATLDGKPFQWKAYRGKVVLIDFWATWCGPCREELANIEKNYKAYHDRGFEVVGISIDQDRQALEDFLEKNEHPWTVLHDNVAANGTAKSMSTYYGILGVPAMILVGRDGKVVCLNARGPQLGKELEKLLGPSTAKDEG